MDRKYHLINKGTPVLTKKKNALFGRYSSCDHLNNALRFLKDGKIDIAEEEIAFAIEKAGGYFHDDIAPFAKQIRTGFWQRVKDKD